MIGHWEGRRKRKEYIDVPQQERGENSCFEAQRRLSSMWIVHPHACCRMMKQKQEMLCVETPFCEGGHDDSWCSLCLGGRSLMVVKRQ